MNQIKVMGIRKTHKWHAAMCKIQCQVKIALNMLNQLYARVVEWQTRRSQKPLKKFIRVQVPSWAP